MDIKGPPFWTAEKIWRLCCKMIHPGGNINGYQDFRDYGFNRKLRKTRNWDSTVDIVMGYRLDKWGLIPGRR
jgi:hypothetical protein